MLFDTTYKSKERDKEIADLIGPAFGFKERLKRKAIGSKRMIVEEVSTGLEDTINETTDLNYGSIELRTGGIMVHLIKGLRNYAWAIPYYQLHTYKTDGFSIHAEGEFIRFRNNRMIKDNKRFFDILANEKIEFTKAHQAPFMD